MMNQFRAFQAVTQDFLLSVSWTRRFMYWTDWGFDERIEKANMDGANRTIVIRSGLYFPSGLALDIAKNWLYWLDWHYDKLEVYEFPSETRREIISSHSETFLSYPLGLALYGNHIYWADSNWNGIYRADRETGGNVVKILSTQSMPTLIHAYDRNNTVIPGISNFRFISLLFFISATLAFLVQSGTRQF